MALILVIEPNPRHAAEVAAMAHRHLQAETLITASAARAVTELGDRIPDLVLTAALLPGHEEVALADHLRQLGDAAAHVQTLTIPILSRAAAKMRGLASSLLRDRGKKDAPDGCDPAL